MTVERIHDPIDEPGATPPGAAAVPDHTATVPSNANRKYSCGVPAVILYPALGAPTFVSASETIHLFLLSKSDLQPSEVNARLKLFGDFGPIHWHKSNGYSEVMEPGNLCTDVASITVDEVTDADLMVQIPELELHGQLNKGVVEFWHKQSGVSNSHTAKVWQVRVDLSGLTPEVAKAIAGRNKFFFHWLDHGRAEKAFLETVEREGEFRHQEFQEMVLYKILKDTTTKWKPLFMGERLWNDLEGQAGSSLSLPCLSANGLAPDKNVLLTDYHPIYRQPKRGGAAAQAPVAKSLNLGVISDLHLVTKLQLLKQSPLRLAPKLPAHFKFTGEGDGTQTPTELFPRIGGLISDSVDVLESHFGAMATDPEVDAVLVVGDLIDFHRDNFPEDRSVLMPLYQTGRETHVQQQAQEVERGKAIWNCMTVPKFQDWKKANLPVVPSNDTVFQPNYQRGTSYLGVFHLVADFVLKCDKPIFLLAGNHDGYSEPFGISPRAAWDESPEAKEYRKLNEGIACDTNLTLQEAALIFGKSYGNFCNIADFDVNVMMLFYVLFSPMRTWSIKTAEQQKLVLLQWADDEAMFLNAQKNEDKSLQIGHLPHAPQMVGEKDMQILTAAVADSGEQGVVLVSHFTYACYAPHVAMYPISQREKNRQSFSSADVIGNLGGTGQIGTGVSNILSKVRPNDNNYGTFHLRRREIFDLIKKGVDGGVAVTISGHAHRAAFYTAANLDASTDVPAEIEVQGWHLDDYAAVQKELQSKCLMVVSDSAGPIPRKNICNELEGWGSQAPSWTKVVFGDEKRPRRLSSVFTSVGKGRPRLGVALDYLESTVCRMIRVKPADSEIGGGVWALVKTFFGAAAPVRTVSPDAFPKTLQDRSDKPLWETDGTVVNDCHPQTMILDPAALFGEGEGQPCYAAEIFTAFVSQRITSEMRNTKNIKIKLAQNFSCIALPEGVTFGTCSLIWKPDGQEGVFHFTLTPGGIKVGGNAIDGVGLEMALLWTMTTVGTQQEWVPYFRKMGVDGNPISGQGWLRYTFSGQNSLGAPYDTETPWIVPCVAGFFPIEPQDVADDKPFRFVLYRDIWGGERPRHDDY